MLENTLLVNVNQTILPRPSSPTHLDFNLHVSLVERIALERLVLKSHV